MAFLLLQYRIVWYTIFLMPKIIARSKKKTVNVQVMLTEADGGKLKRLASKKGATVSDLLRAQVKRMLEETTCKS